MCQSETMHQITNFFSVNNNKGKTNDNITDNKDSNNNNKCISVTVSVKTVNKTTTKMGKGFTNVLQFDTRVDLSVYTDWMPVMLKINI
jgi:hypothetical protein